MVMAGVTLWSQLVIYLHVSLYEPFGQEVTITNVSGAGQTRYLGFGLGNGVRVPRLEGESALLPGSLFLTGRRVARLRFRRCAFGIGRGRLVGGRVRILVALRFVVLCGVRV